MRRRRKGPAQYFTPVARGEFVYGGATPDGYREKGRFAPPAQPQGKRVGQFTDNALAYPVIANGTLYIRDLGTMWAWDIKAR